jgi:hypothetical protein
VFAPHCCDPSYSPSIRDISHIVASFSLYEFFVFSRAARQYVHRLKLIFGNKGKKKRCFVRA